MLALHSVLNTIFINIKIFTLDFHLVHLTGIRTSAYGIMPEDSKCLIFIIIISIVMSCPYFRIHYILFGTGF